MNVTIFRTFSDVGSPMYADARGVLNAIKNGKVKDEIEAIRSAKSDEEVSRLKKKLPCVLWAGRFAIPVTIKRDDGTMYNSYRTDQSLSEHSKLIPFDVDDVDDIAKYKEDAKKDDFIYALWVSPSGTGLHGLIKIADGTKHDEHYTAILKRYPIFDPTARNPSRVLFFSYDPDIYINPEAKTFFELSEKITYSGTNMTTGFTDYKRLGIAARMIRISEQGARHNAVIKSSYLIGGLIAGGVVEENIGRAVLEHEVNIKFDNDDLATELRAIDDGIKAGKYAPISDIEKHENEVWEAVGAIEDELSFLSNNRLDEDYIRKYRAGLIPMGKPFGYDDMDKYLLIKEGEFYATLSHSHTGKAQPLSSKILTPKGWKLMRDINTGDSVIGLNGMPQTVLGVFPQGLRDVYKVHISDGTFVYCDKEHLWSVNKYRMRHGGKRDSSGVNRYVCDNSFVTIPLSEMIGNEKINGSRKNGMNNYMLPQIAPISFDSKATNIEPYLMGALLGDGTMTGSNCVSICGKDEEVFDNVSKSSYHRKTVVQHRGERSIIVAKFKHEIVGELKELGLYGKNSENKFIPDLYKYNSIDCRIAVLTGLMDTDGTVDKYGSMSFSTISKRLCDDIIELVNSLGGRATVKEKQKTYTYNGERLIGKLCYNVSIRIPNNIIPFTIKRKIDKINTKRKQEVYKYITKIEYSHKEECQCIKVSNKDQIYITDNYVPTHNTTVNLWLIFLSALKYDWCWVVYTGENRVASVKMRIIEFFVGSKINNTPEDFFQQGIKFVNERFFFINNDNMHDYMEILKYTESVSKFHSIKGVLIDPVNALKIGKQNKYDHEMEMYTNMLLFTKRTSITIFLSIHTRTQAQRERDKQGNQLMPYPADADGGAVLYNKSDVFIVMNRNIQDPETWMFTELYVSKMRNKESGGDITPKGQAIKLRMQKGIEFTDEMGHLPFERDYLKMDKKLIGKAREEDFDDEL
jgi:hypothetical protein